MASNTQRVVAGLVIGSAGVLSAMNRWERPPAEQKTGASVVYADKLAGGLPTVCSGHTDWKMRVGTPYTKEECDSIDGGNAQKYGAAILQCTGHTERHPVLNQNRLDALTLFAINVGPSAACGSRAVSLIKAGKPEEGCKALANAPDGRPVWSYANGGKTFVQGLYNRRLFERDWCLRPMPKPTPVKVETA